MTTAEHPIRVELPAEPGFLRIARLNATAYGSRVDLDVEQLDDLRLAVNEALTWMIDDPEGPATMVLRIHQDGDQIVVAGGPDDHTAQLHETAQLHDTAQLSGTAQLHETAQLSGTAPSSPLDELVAAILAATVDDFWLDSRTPRRFELRKSATDADLCL